MRVDQPRGRKCFSSRQVKRTTVIKFTICCLCLLGCIAHLVIVSLDYFKFKTVALYGSYIPYEQQMPFVTVCLKQTEGIRAQINQSSVITDCHLRDFSSQKLEEVNCGTGYIVTRASHEEIYDCYTIRSRADVSYTILEASAVLESRRVLYTFSLSPQLDNLSEMITMMHFKQRANEEFHSPTHTQINERKRNLSIILDYELFEEYKLAPPYDTHCIDASLCLDSTGKRYKWCKKDICVNNVTITSTKEEMTQRQGIYFEVETLASPSTRIEFVPQKRPSSFILETCSLLGLWLSWSVHLLSEFALKLITRRRSKSSPKLSRNLSFYDTIISVSKRAGIKMSTLRIKMLGKSQKSDSPRSLTRMFCLSIKLLLVILFLRELTLLSIDYFQYETRVDIEMTGNGIEKYPRISMCITSYEWLNRTEPSQDFEKYDQLMTEFTRDFNYTLKDVFDSTPSGDETIKNCHIRLSPSSAIVAMSNCSAYFTVSKFSFGQFICFYFEPNMVYIAPEQIQQNTTIFYSLVLQDDLARMSNYQTMVSYGLPTDSRLLANELWRQSDYENVNLDFIMYRYRYLPSPYDTDCVPATNPRCCKAIKCDGLKSIGRVPSSEFFQKPIDARVISYVDLKNETLATQVDRMMKKCKHGCKSACSKSMTKTISHLSQSTESRQLTLRTPKYSVYIFKSVPVYFFYQYLYQLACSASFWIGLSLFSVLRQLSRWGGHLGCKSTTVLQRKMAQQMRSIIHRRFDLGDRTEKEQPMVRIIGPTVKRLVYISALMLGFCVHSSFVMELYFTYPTTIDTTYKLEANHEDMRASVCISLDQLDLRGNYSLMNIWDASPRSADLMIECGHRGFNLPTLSHVPTNLRRRIMPYVNSISKCNSLMRVRKFVTLGLVCYEVSPEKGTINTEFRSEFHLGLPRVYMFNILSQNASRYHLTVAVSQGTSINSLLLPASVDATNATSINRFYFISYFKYSITSPSYPYHIGVYDSLERIMCMRDCLGSSHESNNSISPFATTWIVSTRLYESSPQSASLKSKAIRRLCTRKCEQIKRFERVTNLFFDSTAQGPYNTVQFLHLNGTIGLWFQTTNQLVTMTVFYPELRLLDLVLFIGSLFSVWFGFSALHLIDWLSTKLQGSAGKNCEKVMQHELRSIDQLITTASNPSIVHGQSTEQTETGLFWHKSNFHQVYLTPQMFERIPFENSNVI